MLATKTKVKKMEKLLKDGEIAPCNEQYCKNCYLLPLCNGRLLSLSRRMQGKLIRGEIELKA